MLDPKLLRDPSDHTLTVDGPNPGPERLVFFTLLTNELVYHHQDQLIVGGDFNCTLGFTLDRIGEEPRPQSARTLNRVTTHLDLLDTWRIQAVHIGEGC